LEKLVKLNASAAEREKTHWNYNLMHGVHLIQVKLCVLAITSILEPNSCWKTLTCAVQETHMLDRLFHTCLQQSVYRPNICMYTSDITLESGFLTLLKKYVPDKVSLSIMEGGSTLYLHPGWTKETIKQLENTGHAVEVQTWITLHNHFLGEFIDWGGSTNGTTLRLRLIG
jgi:hypothetical protein